MLQLENLILDHDKSDPTFNVVKAGSWVRSGYWLIVDTEIYSSKPVRWVVETPDHTQGVGTIPGSDNVIRTPVVTPEDYRYWVTSGEGIYSDGQYYKWSRVLTSKEASTSLGPLTYSGSGGVFTLYWPEYHNYGQTCYFKAYYKGKLVLNQQIF